ncbi:zinc permease [Candidatus Bathyarchaeota archaeon]|nr:MAG: zinc permease [Candidatus Bathyarchaeota archaeon]
MEDVWIILLISFLSGSTTVIGALLATFLKGKKNYVSIGVGFSSGIMIIISFLELLATALTMMDELFVIFAFALGFMFVLIIDVRLPHMHLIEEKGISGHLIKISYLVAIGILIHDFPEGFAMASSFWVEVRLGLLVALGIAIHNIPEEFALAVPLVLTNKMKLLMKFLVLSALAEPFGAIFGIALTSLIPEFNSFFLAFAAGVMVFVSVDELVPLAYEYDGMHYFAIGLIAGITSFLVLSTLF